MEHPRYKNGKIYSLFNSVSDKVYVGSTCMPLSKRLSSHKYHYKSYKKGTTKTKSSSIILFEEDFENVHIKLIEEYPCDNKKELEKREGFWIRNTPKRVNMKIAGRTDKEYRKDHITERRVYKKKWRKENYEIYREQENKNRRSEYYRKRQRNHYHSNIELKREYHRKYQAYRNEVKRLLAIEY